MGPDPRFVQFVIKTTIAASLVIVAFCMMSTAHLGAALPQPVAYAAGQSIGYNPSDPSPSLSVECEVSLNFSPNIRQWCEPIMDAAQEHGLSPDLVAAVILQESGGDPLAYSSSGAVGLMQVMPRDGIAATFNCINGPCFASRPTIQELQDPDFNIAYGARMLAGLLSRHGNMRDALKAYGPVGMGHRYADAVLAIYENYGD